MFNHSGQRLHLGDPYLHLKLLSLAADFQEFEAGSWWRPRSWETTFGWRAEVMQVPSSQVLPGDQPTQEVSFSV